MAPNYSRFFGPDEHPAGTTYPSGLIGPKGARGKAPISRDGELNIQESPTQSSGAMSGLEAAMPHTSLGGPSIDQRTQFGAFGPENVTQGPFGRDMSVTNPMWARWFDMLHQAAPGGATRVGDTPPSWNPSVQPGVGNLTTFGHPAGEVLGGVPSQMNGTPGAVENAPHVPLGNYPSNVPTSLQQLIKFRRGR